MVEKGVRCRICHATHLYVKANNKYMKDYDKNKESSYLKYWDLNSLYGWAMPQKRPVDDFRWVENKSQFNEDFIENYNKDIDEGYFFEFDFQYPEKLHDAHNDLLFLPERGGIEKVEKLATNVHDKKKNSFI